MISGFMPLDVLGAGGALRCSEASEGNEFTWNQRSRIAIANTHQRGQAFSKKVSMNATSRELFSYSIMSIMLVDNDADIYLWKFTEPLSSVEVGQPCSEGETR